MLTQLSLYTSRNSLKDVAELVQLTSFIHVSSIFLFSFHLLFSRPFYLFPRAGFRSVRKTLWPLWHLTPSLWVCLCHRGAEQAVGVKRRAQVRPNQNASTSPTSPSASETQTCVRCSGYDVHLAFFSKMLQDYTDSYIIIKCCVYFWLNINILTFTAIWKNPWCRNHLQWAGVKGGKLAYYQSWLLWKAFFFFF